MRVTRARTAVYPLGGLFLRASLNGCGYVKLGGHQRAVGREHAGKAVTVVLEDGIATVLDGDRVPRRLVLRP